MSRCNRVEGSVVKLVRRCRRIGRRPHRRHPGSVGRAAGTDPRGPGGPSGRDLRSRPAVRCVLRRSDDQRDLVPDAVAAGARASRRWSPGASPGEYLAMADNGFGNKANSFDFLLRAYFVRPDFKTAKGGTGSRSTSATSSSSGIRTASSASPSSGRDRLLTGADLDPESLQRGKDGDLWMGDEFGPWILHFDETGVLLEPPFRVPAGLVGSTSVTGFLESPASPFISSAAAGDRGRQPGLRIDGGDARRQVPVRAARRRDGAGLEQGPPVPAGVQHPPTGPSRAGSGSTARSRRSRACSSAASWPTCGPSTSTGWS